MTLGQSGDFLLACADCLAVALKPRRLLKGLLGGAPGDGGLLGARLAHAVGESFDRAGVEALLAEILSRDVDLGPLAGAADRYVGVLPIGLPNASPTAPVAGSITGGPRMRMRVFAGVLAADSPQ